MKKREGKFSRTPFKNNNVYKILRFFFVSEFCMVRYGYNQIVLLIATRRACRETKNLNLPY